MALSSEDLPKMKVSTAKFVEGGLRVIGEEKDKYGPYNS
jgi:hypothetical protein